MISVLVLTLNEEINLARCLRSVAWSDDILVLDSFSTDRTLEIARQCGVRVLQNRFVNFAEQRNFGLEQGGFKYPWILHLDADEEVTPESWQEMQSMLKSGAKDKDAFRIASQMMFQGRWLKYSSMYPWYQVRLGRREALQFHQVGHGQRETLAPERIGTLRHPLVHHSFAKGLEDWIEKHNRYSTAEARHYAETIGRQPMDWAGLYAGSGDRRRRALKQLFARLPCRPTLRFCYMYFFRLGFLDGAAGLTYCRLLAMYERMIVWKIQELKAKSMERVTTNGH